MAVNGAQPRVPDAEEMHERSREQQTEGMSQQLASASHGSPEQLFEEKDHWEKLSDFDITRDEVPDEIGEALATELSDKYILGNFEREDWRMFGFWAENEIHTLLQEYPDADSLVTGTDYYIMYGRREGLNAGDPSRESDGSRFLKAPLTDEDYRRLWSAGDTKKAGMTLSIKGRALSALTEITAVSRTEKEETSSSDRSWIERIKERL